MKKTFSTAWLGSKLPRKQRKYIFNAPLHIKHSFLSAHLSKDLRTKYGRRSIPIRVGDEVLVMRGKFAKKKAKVTRVDLRRGRVFLENINLAKRDGSKVELPFKAHRLSIQSLNLEDKKRVKSMEKKNAPNKSKR